MKVPAMVKTFFVSEQRRQHVRVSVQRQASGAVLRQQQIDGGTVLVDFPAGEMLTVATGRKPAVSRFPPLHHFVESSPLRKCLNPTPNRQGTS